MLHIAIVDDELESSSLLTAYVERFCRSQNLLWETTVFHDAKELMLNYQPQFELVFLDIEMPGLNGMDAAKVIRKSDMDTTLIFVTGMAQYAIHGYEVEALDFLVKPVEYFSFEMAFRKFMRLYQYKAKQRVTLTLKGQLQILSFSEIKYVEVLDHYLTYHTANGDYTVKGTLSEAQATLQNGPFFKCNRCYLVNVHAITSMNRESVSIGDTRVEVSRSNRKDMMRAVVSSMGGNV